MFRKLFKHEMLSYLRVLLPVELVVIGIALIGRLIQLFESESLIYGFLLSSTLLMYFAALIISSVLISILCIVRFYKHLFTGEGYLSFTLPVTPAQHLWVKIIGATLTGVITTIVSLLSACLLCEGELLIEIFAAIGYLSKLAMNEIGVHYILYIVELLMAVLLSAITQNLLIYACIAIGQTAKKNRIIWAVAAYFIYYFISQTVSTFFSFIYTFAGAFGIFDKIFQLIADHPLAWFHCMGSFSIIFQIILCVVYFIVAHTIIKKKLNLE